MLDRALDLLRDLLAPSGPPAAADHPLRVAHPRLTALRPSTPLEPYEVRLVYRDAGRPGEAPLPFVARVLAADAAGAIDLARDAFADLRLRRRGARLLDAPPVARRLAASPRRAA